MQPMSRDNILLPEAVIFLGQVKSTLSRNFEIDITNELRENAITNLAEEKMRELRYSVPVDGREASS
ncbi:MAG: hypothetical protein IPO37_19130 [Saprospiraceae bacterium]|nr:hypothetical protein [Saprospiraceae bacterium]